jgi:pyridoxine 5-phosphate synthase
MTKLSVNINKVATIRNARGGNSPNVLQFALDCERYGAQGITVHPRPDERHIRYQDVRDLAPKLKTEFNIEGYPNQSFIDLVLETKPAQVTLVPDPPHVLTSNAGWDTIKNADLLREVITEMQRNNIRTSLFIETNNAFIEGAKKVGAERVELYTEAYAKNYTSNKMNAVEDYVKAGVFAKSIGLDLNAGHDLDSENLKYFAQEVKGLDEVSIGHALISDCLYWGLENTIQIYLNQLR